MRGGPPPPAVEDELLTPEEAGAALNVRPRTVRDWQAQGRIDAVRTPGGHRRYRRGDIHALMQERADRRSST